MQKCKSIYLPLTIFILQVFSACINESVAQQTRNNQLGVRLGGYSGFSFRHWNMLKNQNTGFELSLVTWSPYHGSLFSGMIEKNIPLNHNFYLYAGGGVFWGNYEYRPYYYKTGDKWYAYQDRSPYFGLVGVIGCDYYIPGIPVTAGVDMKPLFFNVVYPYFWDAGLNIRYRF